MFSFFNSDKPPYSVEKIKVGQLLEKAEEATVGHFFLSWMSKRPRKALVGTPFILHENEQYVYWGRPLFKRLFSDKRVVDVFYRTAKNELAIKFPNYNKITGNTIRLKLQDVIRKSDECFINVSVYSGDFRAKLEVEYITIQAKCKIRLQNENEEQEEEEANYEVVLDKNTLDLISVCKK